MGGVGGEGGVGWSLILVLYRVLQTVGAEQAGVLRLDLLRPGTGEVLRLVVELLIVLERSVGSGSEIVPGRAGLCK